MRLSYHTALLLGVVATFGCASESSGVMSGSNSDCVSPSCQAGGGAKADYVLTVDGGSGGNAGVDSGATVSAVNVCSSAAFDCNPDDVLACQEASSTGGISGVGGTSVQAGGASGGGASCGGAGSSSLACRVTLTDSSALAQCVDAGTASDGEACTTGADCASGYGCVNDNGVTMCRHYCCSGDESCASDQYCGERIVVEATAADAAFKVNVCLPTVACGFDEPYPCPAEQVCSCPTGTTCGVVRSDGTTACVIPGTGLEGEACPCAAGYVCSVATATCMKTCNLESATTEDCGSGICQASASMPTGVGICVSTTSLS